VIDLVFEHAEKLPDQTLGVITSAMRSAMRSSRNGRNAAAISRSSKPF
jgi:hypothetical protein